MTAPLLGAAPPLATLVERFGAGADPLVDLLLEQPGTGALVMDPAGCVIRTTAYLREMVAGAGDVRRGAKAMLIFAPFVRDLLWQRILAALAGQPPAGAELVALNTAPGDEPRTVELTATVLREADGVASGVILHLVDVSLRHRLAQEQAPGQDRAQAQGQKLQLLGQLAAGIAHDFNNLLTIMIGATDQIEARSGVDAATREDSAAIRGSADRGAALVRQLLAFTRQQPLQPRAVAVDETVHDLSSLLIRLLGSRITLSVDLAAAGFSVWLDPVQLDQVLINLVVNARDAMPNGGALSLRSGLITLHAPRASCPEAVPPGQYVLIEVQDTGSGIDAALLPRIFDPFFTTNPDRGGSGLGLSTVRDVVRSAHGSVAVASEPGQGTCMRVYLPRMEVRQAVDPEISPVGGDPKPILAASAIPPVHPTLLLVDDDTVVRQLAERALTKAGWTVLAAGSGHAALELLAQRHPQPIDALVSDVMMPGLDGPALVAILRERWPGLPALLISGFADEKLRIALQSINAGFLVKPYRLRELTAAAAAMR